MSSVKAVAMITKSGECTNVKFEIAGDLNLLNPYGISKSVIDNWKKKEM